MDVVSVLLIMPWVPGYDEGFPAGVGSSVYGTEPGPSGPYYRYTIR